MPRHKNIYVQSSKSKENITDIFDEIKNDEEITIKNTSKKLIKINNMNKKEMQKINESKKIAINNIKQRGTSQIQDDKFIQQKKEKNKINMEKLAMIDSLCKEYPCLKKDKDKIIKKHLEETKQVKNPFTQNEYTLEKIIIDNKVYYKDDYNNILDENIKLIGFYNDLKTKYEFILLPTKN